MQKHYIFLLLFVLLAPCLMAQTEQPEQSQELENITQGNDDAETEDDSYLQQLEHYKTNKLDINQLSAEELNDFTFLSQLQRQNFLSYRKLFGRFLTIYELQAIPTWDLLTIQKMLPYLTINGGLSLGEDLAARFTQGQHSVLLRMQQVLEESKGYQIKDTTRSRYLGSPQRVAFRYKYQYKNLLQFGLVGDKDAGEQFFTGSQTAGFDFYSFHLFARNLGVVKNLALGDFTVNMGQGLIQYQSLAFKKGPDPLAVKRQAAILRPYNSVGEFNFHRGAGITLGVGNWSATFFASFRKLNANFNKDTSINNEDYVSSLLTSGLNRTPNELADRYLLNVTTLGGNISFNKDALHVGINAINYQMSLPLQTSNEPYNSYDIKGKEWRNSSVDYSYTYKNMHFFGEAATDKNNSLALVSGLLVSLSNTIDASLVYRNISEKYQSLNGNAFTESTFPNNESGLFLGMTVKPFTGLRFDAYADAYSFPWLRFRVDAPTRGGDYFLQATYQPNKQVRAILRFRSESKAINLSNTNFAFNITENRLRQNLRAEFGYKISPLFTWNSRVETVWLNTPSFNKTENGFLIYSDIFYKSPNKRLAGGVRLQYFETDNFDTRIYAYENDVLYSFSIPFFNGRGWRYYLNLNYDVSKRMTAWFRIAQTVQSGAQTIGSGLDEIAGNKKTDYRVQLMYKF
jgi:hypothetical protein